MYYSRDNFFQEKIMFLFGVGCAYVMAFAKLGFARMMLFFMFYHFHLLHIILLFFFLTEICRKIHSRHIEQFT